MKLDIKEIVKLGLILLAISAISAALLAFTNSVTIDKILEQRALAAERDRKATLPSATKFEKLDDEKFKKLNMTLIASSQALEPVLEVYTGYDGDEIVGYVITTTPSGYGGPIKITSGINADGTIGGVRLAPGHQETPGLGAKAELPEFYEQYNGLYAPDKLQVVKASPSGNDILSISGATITSSAVTRGVNTAADVFEALQSQEAK